MTGVFLVLDGPDGCGKSTQAGLLTKRLIASGRAVVHAREPGGTDLGEALREVLLDPSRTPDAVVEACLFSASRRTLLGEVVRPALADGQVVVCERYVGSTWAYQGVAGGAGKDLVRALETAACEGLDPDRVVLLDMDPLRAAERRSGEGDQFERRPPEFHSAVRAAFLELGEERGWSVVDAGRPQEEVAEAVWQAVVGCLGDAA